MPKDISYYRRERELALKKTLQVAESKPLVIPADGMQRELETCLRREYTPENLPLLLLQKQVVYIMQEYSDALQRADRLSVARENFLVGKSNPPNLVTREDLTVYTKWLVCHLHSLKTIHHYLQALQYLPISNVLSVAVDEVSEAGQENEKFHANDTNPDIQGSASPGPRDTRVSGPMRPDAAFVLPQHTTETEELKPQLRLLLSHFNIPYDLEEVSPKFQSIFKEQQRMQMFPDYDIGTAKAENLGLAGPGMALKKRANWISFINIKPKCDPWQKKLLTKLKEQRRIDVLMQLQAKFLKNESMKKDDLLMEQSENRPSRLLHQCAREPVKQETETGYSDARALRLLGLGDGAGPGDEDPVLRRGAYLSSLYLRHLRIRELQVHGTQFMEFSEVENQDDYYSTEAGYVCTQDQQGVYVMYDEALSDLKELETELLLVASHYIEKEKASGLLL